MLKITGRQAQKLGIKVPKKKAPVDPAEQAKEIDRLTAENKKWKKDAQKAWKECAELQVELNKLKAKDDPESV